MIVPTVVAFAQGFHEATCLSLTLGHELRSTESNISVLPFNQLGKTCGFVDVGEYRFCFDKWMWQDDIFRWVWL